MAAIDLEPVPTPLAVFPSSIAQSPTTIIMKESIFSLTEPFTVKTPDGRDVFKISTDALSLSSRKHVYDLEGNHLFTLHKETFSFPKSFYAKSSEGSNIFEIEGKFHIGGSKAVGHLVNATNGEKEDLQMQGSVFNAKTDITNKENKQVVVQIDTQRRNARQLLANRGTYAVTIAPGMDMALIVAMVVYLDEIRQR